MLSRLESFRTCGKAVAVRRCGDCGTDRGGSGTFRQTRTCKTRACPVCARLRSESYADWVELAWSSVEEREGYSWHWLTLTTKYDPYSEDDCSWEALRGRARACAKAARLVWEKLLRGSPGSGCLRTIEVGRRGHVHANLVYWGPALDTAAVEDVARKAAACMGHAHLTKVDRNVNPHRRKAADFDKPQQPRDDFEVDEDPRGSKEGLKRVLRYVSKGLDHESRASTLRDEDLVTGTKSAVFVDPELAVRWEFATYRMHLVQRYGAFRGMELDEHAEKAPADNEDDAEVTCSCCGSVGNWRTAYRATEDWFSECHERGLKALASTPDDWTSLAWEPDTPD